MNLSSNIAGTTKSDKRNDSDIRTRISTRSVSTTTAIITTSIQMRKTKRRKTTRVTTDIIKGGVIMVIDVRRILVGDLMDRDPIDKLGINAAMTIVQMMSGVRGPTGNTVSHHDRTEDSKLGGVGHPRRSIGTDKRGERWDQCPLFCMPATWTLGNAMSTLQRQGTRCK